MKRRGFLMGAGALLAAPSIAKADSLMRIMRPTLILYGDAVYDHATRTWSGHDDSAVLNAVFRGGRAYCLSTKTWMDGSGNYVRMPAGAFLMKSELQIRSREQPLLADGRGSTIVYDHQDEACISSARGPRDVLGQGSIGIENWTFQPRSADAFDGPAYSLLVKDTTWAFIPESPPV